MILQQAELSQLSKIPDFRHNCDDLSLHKMTTTSAVLNVNQEQHCWDINDTSLPKDLKPERFNEWPNNHCKHVYPESSDDARKHLSGWAMRNTNNHNVHILKKSCLGVLSCSLRCTLEAGGKVHLRPAICDKARRKQLGKQCPNTKCTGRLELTACRGHGGYPVTHFWRHIHNKIYFQAKGEHDHPQPEAKSSAEARRQRYAIKENRASLNRKDRKRVIHKGQAQPPYHLNADYVDQMSDYRNNVSKVRRICPCPAYAECVCTSSPQHPSQVYGHPQSSSLLPLDSPSSSCSKDVSPVSRQTIPATSPLFCHYYGGALVTKSEDGSSLQSSASFPPQVPYNQWSQALNVSPHQSFTTGNSSNGGGPGYTGNLVPHPANTSNNPTTTGSSQHLYSPGSTIIHQEFYHQQYSYQPNHQQQQQPQPTPAVEQYSPCLYPCAYYNSPTNSVSSGTEQAAELSSCMNTSMVNVQPTGHPDTSSPEHHPHHHRLLPANSKDCMGDNSPQGSNNLAAEATLSHQRPYHQFQLSPIDKLSPTTPVIHSNNHCLQVSDTSDQDPNNSATSPSSGYQLPAIASIIDGCDSSSNNNNQCNTFQNTTIINQQNLIVWCT